MLRSDIRADQQILDSSRNIRLYVRCDCCGAEHRFSVKDANLQTAKLEAA
jgi:RNase P subunit RPR2